MSRGRATFLPQAAFRAVALAPIVLVAGCALLSKAKPMDVRWYTPEHLRPGPASPLPASGPALRLAGVRSGLDLEQRIVHGDGGYRMDYYEERRWTERPEVYVRNALNRVLFEERGFQRVVQGDATALNVEVLAFQEVNRPAVHGVRIALRIAVSRKRVLFENTVEINEPVSGPRFEDVVAAMARALDEAAGEVARRISTALAKEAEPLSRR